MGSWKKWSDKEDEILEEYVGFRSPKDLSLILRKQGFNRTEWSVKKRCGILKMSYEREFDNLSLSRISNLLGVSRTTACSWYKTGKLKGKPFGEGKEICVKYEDVKKFLLLYANKLKATLNKDGLNFFLGD